MNKTECTSWKRFSASRTGHDLQKKFKVNNKTEKQSIGVINSLIAVDLRFSCTYFLTGRRQVKGKYKEKCFK